MSEDELWDHYETCLRCHDWYYNYSDDHGVWRAGEEQRSHLMACSAAMALKDEKREREMYYSACPWTDKNGVTINDNA